MTLQLVAPDPPSREISASHRNHDLLQIADIVGFLGFAWRHKFRIMLGVAAATILAAVYCTRTSPEYESTAQLLVVKKSPLAVAGLNSGVTINADSMFAHVALIKSPWLANRVLSDQNLRSLATFREEQNPSDSLIHSLSVVHENKNDNVPFSNSNLLKFSFRGPAAEECAIVLFKVIDAYQAYLEESNRTVNQDTFDLISKKVDEASRELDKKEAERRRFLRSAPLTLAPNRSASSHDRMTDIHQRLVELKTKKAETKSRMWTMRNALSNAKDLDAVRSILPENFLPSIENFNRERLLILLVEEAKLSRPFGGDHPNVRAVKDQLWRVKQELRELYVSAGRGYVRSLLQQLTEIAAAEQSLAGYLQVEGEKARKSADLELEDEQLKGAIARDQQLLDALVSRLKGVDLDLESGGYRTTLIAPPVEAIQVAPNKLLIFTASIFLGLLAGFIYAIVADAADRSFHSSHEVIHSLHLPVLGQIPSQPTNGKVRKRTGSNLVCLDPSLCTHFSPSSSSAEAYRGLRTALHVVVRHQKAKVIQVTSPGVRDGKTTVAANLAISLAQSGKHVLLIDADLHVPRIHDLFGLSDDNGLASVLAEESELVDAIQPTGIDDLFVLPCGPRPSSPADVLSSPRLKELFDLVRETYDYVLVDTPALLAVTDSQIVAANVDGVLLAIRYTKNGRPAASRATDILRLSGATILGIVLNCASEYEERVVLGSAKNIDTDDVVARSN